MCMFACKFVGKANGVGLVNGVDSGRSPWVISQSPSQVQVCLELQSWDH